MSLLEQFNEKFYIMEKTRTPDGEGGFISTWSEGEEISLAVRHDSTMEALRAQQEGVTSVYTFLAPKSCGLDYHDVIKRVSDSQCFRLTSHAGEDVTPGTASFNLTSFKAERWELTT